MMADALRGRGELKRVALRVRAGAPPNVEAVERVMVLHARSAQRRRTKVDGGDEQWSELQAELKVACRALVDGAFRRL